jgi:hypothetical protein
MVLLSCSCRRHILVWIHSSDCCRRLLGVLGAAHHRRERARVAWVAEGGCEHRRSVHTQGWSTTTGRRGGRWRRALLRFLRRSHVRSEWVFWGNGLRVVSTGRGLLQELYGVAENFAEITTKARWWRRRRWRKATTDEGAWSLSNAFAMALPINGNTNETLSKPLRSNYCQTCSQQSCVATTAFATSSQSILRCLLAIHVLDCQQYRARRTRGFYLVHCHSKQWFSHCSCFHTSMRNDCVQPGRHAFPAYRPGSHSFAERIRARAQGDAP